MRFILSAGLGVITVFGAAATADAEPPRHIPPAEAIANAPVELAVEARAADPALALHFRVTGDAAYQVQKLSLQQGVTWIGVVPAAAVHPPGVEYFIAQGDAPVFASAERPHRLLIQSSESSLRRQRDLARRNGRRSRAQLAGQWVSFGKQQRDGVSVRDDYYRIDADFSYLLLSYPLEEIRFGYSRLYGQVPSDQCTGPCDVPAGYKVGGWGEVGIGLLEGVRLDGRIRVMATAEGFNLGGGGELRVGDGDRSHVALGVDYAADVGTSGYFRLGFATVPRLPMATTVEITNLPSNDQPTAVRLIYDLFLPLPNGLRPSLRVGYAARDQNVPGLSAGVAASFDF